MKTGDLNRRILIEKQVETRNESNELIQNWECELMLWASKNDTGYGTEEVEGRRVESSGRTEWIIRYRKLERLTTKRVKEVATGQIYDIEEVLEVGRKQTFLKLICLRIEQR